ncbi:MAG: hypothetical protein F4114_18630 [Rhodospirillaceae bacterium]|nr:hypothetical protein [Rhodospirillaceae bacterium]MYB12435.1 hypothetical protein [Rhodospirillaceae bacterium]MYI51087.1 hypothetical protein [Rhodospirillaceae bacterium]
MKLRLQGLDSLGNWVANTRFDLCRKLGALPEMQAQPAGRPAKNRNTHVTNSPTPAAERMDTTRLRQIAAVPEPAAEAAKKKAAGQLSKGFPV